MTQYEQGSWESLAQRASTELDPKKLMLLVEQLNLTLEQKDRTSKRLQQGLV